MKFELYYLVNGEGLLVGGVFFSCFWFFILSFTMPVFDKIWVLPLIIIVIVVIIIINYYIFFNYYYYFLNYTFLSRDS